MPCTLVHQLRGARFSRLRSALRASGQDALSKQSSNGIRLGVTDRFPITPQGRLAAVILMVAGVGAFGTRSEGWSRAEHDSCAKETDSELAQIKAMLAVAPSVRPIGDGSFVAITEC